MSNTNNKIKVVGYAQRVFYSDGIEYRNFTPDLVGNQLTSNGGTPLFTMGNFAITTNMDPKLDKTYITNKFSNFVTLSDLALTPDEAQVLLDDNANVILNLDKTKLNYYALFGSLTEFARVSLEQIIINWPASLYATPISQTESGSLLTGNTVENYAYDNVSELSTFRLNTNLINNKFQINYQTNGTILDTFNASNGLRNLTINYSSYVIYFNDVEYPIVNFTGSTNLKNDYIYFEVKGNPFSGFGVNSNVVYHIKPNTVEVNKFFNTLPDFESYLLNRQVTPLYTASFKYPVKSDTGIILYVTDTITWPVSDGYNIDFDTTEYVDYVNKLLEITTDNDLFSSDLMNRFLVSESISAFDTTPVHLSEQDQDTSGQKMNKTLHIYGRSFDDFNKFIEGISFANTVTYNKLDNTPDAYLKNLARVLGWEVVSSVLENDLLKNYVTTSKSSYSGLSVGYTPVEADVELWRRLILNTPWLWKSKGARKSVEFLLKFIGAPQGLVQFNEYIYKAEGPIDIDLFKQVLELNGLDSTDLSIYPFDSDGYPTPLPDTPDMYFQNDGLWYRQTGGSASTIDILVGNNPHVGPYDGGYKYINQFNNLIPNFSAVTLTSQTITTGTTNIFTNYGLGVITNYSGDTYVDVTDENGNSLEDCIVVVSSIIQDPMPSDYITDCGCASADDDDSLSICISGNTSPQPPPCPEFITPPSDNTDLGLYVFQQYQYNMDGSYYLDTNGDPVPNVTYFTPKACCNSIGGTSYLYNATNSNGQITTTGYVCCDNTGKCGCTVSCKWLANTSPISLPPHTPSYSGPQEQYLTFTRPDGGTSIVTPDGCNCVSQYTIAVPNVVDPNTGEIGYACQLTADGKIDILSGVNSNIYYFYEQKKLGNIDCYTNTLNFS